MFVFTSCFLSPLWNTQTEKHKALNYKFQLHLMFGQIKPSVYRCAFHMIRSICLLKHCAPIAACSLPPSFAFMLFSREECTGVGISKKGVCLSACVRFKHSAFCLVYQSPLLCLAGERAAINKTPKWSARSVVKYCSWSSLHHFVVRGTHEVSLHSLVPLWKQIEKHTTTSDDTYSQMWFGNIRLGVLFVHCCHLKDWKQRWVDFDRGQPCLSCASLTLLSGQIKATVACFEVTSLNRLVLPVYDKIQNSGSQHKRTFTYLLARLVLRVISSMHSCWHSAGLWHCGCRRGIPFSQMKRRIVWQAVCPRAVFVTMTSQTGGFKWHRGWENNSLNIQ